MERYDERFQHVIENEISKIVKKAENKALCHDNGGNWPKKSIADRIRNSERYVELKKEYEEKLGANKLRNALKDDDMLDNLAKSGKYDASYKEYCAKHETEEERSLRIAEEEKAREGNEKLATYLKDCDLLKSLRNVEEIVFEEKRQEIISHLSEMEPLFPCCFTSDYDSWNDEYEEGDTVDSDNFDCFLEVLTDNETPRHLCDAYVEDICGYEEALNEEIVDTLLNKDSYLNALNLEYPDLDLSRLYDYVIDECIYEDVIRDLLIYFDEPTIMFCLTRNNNFKNIIREVEINKQKTADVKQAIIDKIPENVIDLYPSARKLKRKFTLHIGPTNSGKTFSAMEALREAGSGIYLAPLRLLAFEQYEKLNVDGYPCNMVTGEERKKVEGAVFTASTIEVANFEKVYRHVVIDEAQMITDPSRGGAWTSAILGICSENISVCLSPDAEGLIVRLVNMCGDEYEIVRHNRKVPLTVESNGFNFPKSVKDGDALIVFSKKNVHAVAAELQEKNITCSIIYGALPYDVRHEEARKFASGETKVLVATDAIGMGLNLPIKRVVFLEVAKFDGTCKRVLKPAEIKQIAGRAGRYGKYDE